MPILFYFPKPHASAWQTLTQQDTAPQLEKNDVVNPSPQDEALASYSVSREVSRSVLKFETVLSTVSRSVLKFETVLSTFDVTPKVPRHPSFTRGEHRGSRHHFI